MNEIVLFLHRFEQLTGFITNRKLNELVDISDVVRKLIIDGDNLTDKANRQLKLKIQYQVSRSTEDSIQEDSESGFPAPDYMWALDNGPFPTKLVNRDRFLNHKVVYCKGDHFSIKEVIRFCANRAGGVHLASEDQDNFRQKILRKLDKEFGLGGASSMFRAMRSIGGIVHEALHPLYMTLRYRNVWVVIPAYNEEGKLAEVLRGVLEFVPNVVVVDDGSLDGTHEVARDCGVHALQHKINRGQGAALATGIEYALRNGAETIVTFDSDGQHTASEIPMMLEPLMISEADVVLGSRFLQNTHKNMPKLRQIIVKGGILFTKMLSQINVTDTHNGFRALSRYAAEQIEINQDRMAHASEILDQITKKNLKYIERPVTITYTDYSKARGQGNLNAIRIAARMIFSKLF